MLVFWSRDPDGAQHNHGDSLGKLVPGINGPTSLAGIRNADDNLATLRRALDALEREEAHAEQVASEARAALAELEFKRKSGDQVPARDVGTPLDAGVPRDLGAAAEFRGSAVKVPAAYVGADAHAARFGYERPHHPELFALVLDTLVQRLLRIVEHKRYALATGARPDLQIFPVIVEVAQLRPLGLFTGNNGRRFPRKHQVLTCLLIAST